MRHATSRSLMGMLGDVKVETGTETSDTEQEVRDLVDEIDNAGWFMLLGGGVLLFVFAIAMRDAE